MKKTIAITSALAATSSLATAEIKINEFLSFAGFVDSSYSHTSLESGPAKGSANSYGVDEVEIDWIFNLDRVTARVDLQHLGGGTVEQAYATYDLGSGFSVTAGRFESALGLEAKEATGLYQWSKAYDFGSDDNDDSSVGSLNFLPQYNQGVKLTKVSGDNVFSFSVLDEFTGAGSGRFGGDRAGGNSNYAFEASALVALSDGITWFLGGAYEVGENDGTNAYVGNTHLTVQSGALTYGIEASYGDTEQGPSPAGSIESMQGMIMANYAYSDNKSVTGRISYTDISNKSIPAVKNDADFLKYTLAHNYAVTDNFAVITEFSYVDGTRATNTDYKALVGAVEVLFSF